MAGGVIVGRRDASPGQQKRPRCAGSSPFPDRCGRDVDDFLWISPSVVPPATSRPSFRLCEGPPGSVEAKAGGEQVSERT